LLAAVVRVTAEKGYEKMAVVDVLDCAAVGRQTFYELFDDRLDCLLAAHELLVDDLAETVGSALEGSGPWPERVRAALAVGLEWLAASPDAAKVMLVELATIGPLARERFQVTFDRFVAMLDEGLQEPGAPADLPNITSLAAAAALIRVYEETANDRATELRSLLPELTFELLVPFVGEDIARETAHGGAD
jgi:AcrR family transcriptional regulator